MNLCPSSLNVTDITLSAHTIHARNFRVLENGNVVFHRLLGFMIEPQKWRDLVHPNLLSVSDNFKFSACSRPEPATGGSHRRGFFID
jgi:hypothetical protein